MSGSDFWSRRRAAVAAEEEQERKAKVAEDQAAERDELAQKTDEEVLAELNLPDPDTLGEGDDFSGFMKAIVPQRLKRRALRRLWTTNPVLANLDGLIEYGEDYTDAATVVENLTTAYQVGKGMTKHVEEMLRQMAEDPDTEEGDDSARDAEIEEDEAPSIDDEPAVGTEVAQNMGDDPLEIAEDTPNFDEEVKIPYAPIRRMRYRFE